MDSENSTKQSSEGTSPTSFLSNSNENPSTPVSTRRGESSASELLGRDATLYADEIRAQFSADMESRTQQVLQNFAAERQLLSDANDLQLEKARIEAEEKQANFQTILSAQNAVLVAQT